MVTTMHWMIINFSKPLMNYRIAAAFLVVFVGVITPSTLSIPTKGRESSGLIVDSRLHLKELQCIRSALWNEVRGEPEEGIRAVMSVIYNRKKAKGFPSTFCAVILQPKQFSAFDSGKIRVEDKIEPLGAKDKEAYTKIAKIAREAATGAFEPTLAADVLWYAHKKVKNHWTRKYKVVKIVKLHVFYKES